MTISRTVGVAVFALTSLLTFRSVAASQNPGGDVRLLEDERAYRAKFPSIVLLGRKDASGRVWPYVTQMRAGKSQTLDFTLPRGRYMSTARCEVDLCRDLRIELFDSNGRKIPLIASQTMQRDGRDMLLPFVEYFLAEETALRMRISLGHCSYEPCWIVAADYEVTSCGGRPCK